MATSEVLSAFAPFISWMFLPGIVTDLLLRFLYNNRILTLPGTAIQADVHKKRVRTLVIVGYLVYTIYASLFKRPSNFYELLRVETDTETETVRRSFRKLARVYHPDKMGGGLKNERLFIDLRRGHDCLIESVKRMAYDRFGEVVLDWTEAITTRDFFIQGLQDSLSFYIINPLMFGFMHWINGQRIINYWQFSLLAFLFALELSLIFRPTPPALLRTFFGQSTQHNLVSALHTSYIAITLASSHLCHLLPSPKGGGVEWQNRTFDKDINEMKEDLEGFRNAMIRMDGHWRRLAAESERAVARSLIPLRPAATSSADTSEEAAAAVVNEKPSIDRSKPSAIEETYIHLLSRLILVSRLRVIPGILSSTSAEVHPRAVLGEVATDPSSKFVSETT